MAAKTTPASNQQPLYTVGASRPGVEVGDNGQLIDVYIVPFTTQWKDKGEVRIVKADFSAQTVLDAIEQQVAHFAVIHGMV